MADLAGLYQQWLSLPNDATRYAMMSSVNPTGLSQYIQDHRFGGNLQNMNQWINSTGINGGYTANFNPNTGAYGYRNNGQLTTGNVQGYQTPTGIPSAPGLPGQSSTNSPVSPTSVWNQDYQNPWIGATNGDGTYSSVPTVNSGGAITNSGGGTLGGLITQQGTPMPKLPISQLKPGQTGTSTPYAPSMNGVQAAGTVAPAPTTKPVTKTYNTGLRPVWG